MTEMTRRHFAGVLAAGAACGMGGMRGARAAGNPWDALAADFASLEKRSGGRLGVAVLDTFAGAQASHRGDERFPMCSTFKLLAAAAILSRVDAGHERLDRRITFAPGDVVDYSPMTKPHAGGEGMTLDAICEAAVTVSDNTAGNLMLAALGGPAGLTAYVRTLGDEVTRLDRTEPTLNESIPGDPRDTTSPAAMLSDLRALLVGDALSAPSREKLTGWLVGNKVGDARLRAGVPMGWRVGDKTGTGDNGSTNDVGIIWPPGRAPLLVAVYLTQTSATIDDRNAIHASVARAVVNAMG